MNDRSNGWRPYEVAYIKQMIIHEAAEYSEITKRLEAINLKLGTSVRSHKAIVQKLTSIGCGGMVLDAKRKRMRLIGEEKLRTKLSGFTAKKFNVSKSFVNDCARKVTSGII